MNCYYEEDSETELFSYLRMIKLFGDSKIFYTFQNAYGERDFLHNVLDILMEVKFVMRTGVCEYTYIHWAYVKQWIVNTYHLKRIERVSGI